MLTGILGQFLYYKSEKTGSDLAASKAPYKKECHLKKYIHGQKFIYSTSKRN